MISIIIIFIFNKNSIKLIILYYIVIIPLVSRHNILNKSINRDLIANELSQLAGRSDKSS